MSLGHKESTNWDPIKQIEGPHLVNNNLILKRLLSCDVVIL